VRFDIPPPAPNQPPTVTLTLPANGGAYTVPSCRHGWDRSFAAAPGANSSAGVALVGDLDRVGRGRLTSGDASIGSSLLAEGATLELGKECKVICVLSQG